jgi:hypothetical protein
MFHARSNSLVCARRDDGVAIPTQLERDALEAAAAGKTRELIGMPARARTRAASR